METKACDIRKPRSCEEKSLGEISEFANEDKEVEREGGEEVHHIQLFKLISSSAGARLIRSKITNPTLRLRWICLKYSTAQIINILSKQTVNMQDASQKSSFI